MSLGACYGIKGENVDTKERYIFQNTSVTVTNRAWNNIAFDPLTETVQSTSRRVIF